MQTTQTLQQAILQKQLISRTLLEAVIANSSRQELIELLIWNDPNGCYSDEDCGNEGLSVLSLEDIKALMEEMLMDTPKTVLV